MATVDEQQDQEPLYVSENSQDIPQNDADTALETGETRNLASADESAFATIEGSEFVEFAEGDAAAMSGATETLGNSAAGIASAFVALIVGLAMLA